MIEIASNYFLSFNKSTVYFSLIVAFFPIYLYILLRSLLASFFTPQFYNVEIFIPEELNYIL